MTYIMQLCNRVMFTLWTNFKGGRSGAVRELVRLPAKRVEPQKKDLEVLIQQGGETRCPGPRSIRPADAELETPRPFTLRPLRV